MRLSVCVASVAVLCLALQAAPSQANDNHVQAKLLHRVARQMPPGMPDMDGMKDKMPAPPGGMPAPPGMPGRRRREARGGGAMPTRKD